MFLGSVESPLHLNSYSLKSSSQQFTGGSSGTALEPIFWQGMNLTLSGLVLIYTSNKVTAQVTWLTPVPLRYEGRKEIYTALLGEWDSPEFSVYAFSNSLANQDNGD